MTVYCRNTQQLGIECYCDACEDMRAEDVAAERQHDARKEVGL